MSMNGSPGGFSLTEFPVHLDAGVGATREPAFDGTPQWYQAYAKRHAEPGRLLAMSEMTGSWTSWEVHPHGHEVVIVIEGAMTLIQEIDGAEHRIELKAGQTAINPPGVWHTADLAESAESATIIFITAGAGTEHRPR